MSNMIRHARALGGDAKERKGSGEFLVEGFRALEGVMRAGGKVTHVFADDETSLPMADLAVNGCEVHRVQLETIKKIATTKNPQGIVGICEMPTTSWKAGRSVLVAMDINDPGNMGTLVRSAAAFDWNFMVAGDSADPFNPKCVRASAGSVASGRVAISSLPELQMIGYLRDFGLNVIASTGNGGCRPNGIGNFPIALVVGGEANGLGDQFIESCDGAVTIPISENVESLNVASAAAILLAMLTISCQNDLDKMGEHE